MELLTLWENNHVIKSHSERVETEEEEEEEDKASLLFHMELPRGDM